MIWLIIYIAHICAVPSMAGFAHLSRVDFMSGAPAPAQIQINAADLYDFGSIKDLCHSFFISRWRWQILDTGHSTRQIGGQRAAVDGTARTQVKMMRSRNTYTGQ